MPTQLLKLDPRYTVSLRGFDNFGAAAAVTQATSSGFTVSGVFRDAADFAVLYLYDADDFFGHPIFKYLPDFSLSGLVLEFDLTYDGIQQIDSQKFPTIDWPYLDVIREDQTTGQVSLFANASQNGGSYLAASAQITVLAPTGADAFDRVTIWFQNFAFDFNAVGGETAAAVATNLALQINEADWAGAQAVSAVASGAVITITAEQPGSDGNMITLYTQSKTGTLQLTPATVPLLGGVSSATWHVKLDFTALGIDSVRQMWLTFAPALANGAAYAGTEWTAIFANWKVTDPNGIQPLKVAGPGSVRIEESDSWCVYSGSSWESVDSTAGFWSKGFAKQASAAGDSVTVKYWCAAPHSLYLGTALSPGYGTWGVSVDGGVSTAISTNLTTTSQIQARRLIKAGMTLGWHTVKLTLSSGTAYFDFIEAAVLSDVPDPPGPWADRSPAVDYDTMGYLLPPARLMAFYDWLGYRGEMNLYVGVFWWMQKIASGEILPFATCDFSQTTYLAGGGFGDGDQVFVVIGGASFGKTIFPLDVGNPTGIAEHFAFFINETAAGVVASTVGPVLTITLRAVGSSYDFTLSIYKNTMSTPLAFTGGLTGGTLATWVIDTSQTQPLNRGVRDWMADFFSECASRGRGCAVSYSMELCYPPASWAATFPDGTAVVTATGFGTINSTQCAPSIPGFLAYQQSVFLATAAIIQAAGVPIVLQCGEFLWWYFANASGMAYYDATTKAAALALLGRPLHIYLTPNDDPSVIGYADANFLRDRLRDHVAAIASVVKESLPTALFEVLYPYDVNYPQPAGVDMVGGQLNNYVNTPPEWMQPGTLDRIKVESLDREISSRSLDLALQTMMLPLFWGWPPGLVRYLFGVYNGGAPWQRCLLAGQGLGLAGFTPFAMDHVCQFGWDVDEPLIDLSAQVV